MVRKEDQTSVNLNSLRDTLLTFVSLAGKGKDEVLQVLARETGTAIAALLHQPLADLAKHNRLQVTIELVPKSKGSPSPHVGKGHERQAKKSDAASGKRGTRRAAKPAAPE
jgi:hypothetical protein